VKVINGCRIEEKTVCPNANLAGADLRGAYLTNAHLNGANLQGADLRGAFIHDTHLEGANLKQANLSGANLIRSQLKHANLNEANLQSVKADEASFYQVHMQHADLQRGSFEEAHFFGSQIDHSNLIAASLRRAHGHAVNFAGSNLGEIDGFLGNFSGANFVNAALNGAKFHSATLSHANFAGANFSHTNLSATEINGTNFVPSNIENDGHGALRYVFDRIYSHVNAYGTYGTCNGDSTYQECFGANDDPNATSGFKGKVKFYFTDAAHGRTFTVTGQDAYLQGTASSNLGAFYVGSASGTSLDDLGGTGVTMGAGQPGGPLALHVGYARALGSNGYVMNMRGWIQRETKARASLP